jgi:hypothetical protein
MTKHANAVIVFTNNEDSRIGSIVASLIREHIAFDLTYDPGNYVVIAVENSDAEELNQIIRTTC